MTRIIHARLDAATEKLLKEMERRLGWNDSRLVREGIKALRALLFRGQDRKIIRQGAFRSGKPDLGTNKKHLEGFGR